MLKFALVNDYDIREVYELNLTEFYALTATGAVFMCMKDTLRLSEQQVIGVLAFHPFGNKEDSYREMVNALQQARGEQPDPTELTDTLTTKDGTELRHIPITPKTWPLN